MRNTKMLICHLQDRFLVSAGIVSLTMYYILGNHSCHYGCRWFMDGNFSMAPPVFLEGQLYVIRMSHACTPL